ncbi:MULTISPECIES: transcription antitermination factor NusB [unclassified Synechococcus]|jgi:N utilization substance protein B|uniref:transcription antitermination factor NusB n=1 Tax=unclassified Synechococcus TaxID=2626047 RepID=UPI000E0EC2B2|nr:MULTISPECIES: transcription antitermination factor NusB [unclassified Synechococcus]MCB4378814.1 transcription antitermination protein NusB [Synechococcus sp. MU1650]MCB4399556.1 transcription antitermination protein NusB [Synechococcus sp. MU1625]MCB4411425.1 transcription antitermination protein NusB [Synechococcus sp. MU1611]|tara:strand:- start:346 stop:981 length:636 start_codon:yes stop_codon:yes gene_type:complete
MATRSLSRELALLVLGQVPEQKSASVADLALDSILDQALDTLTQHWRESLDASAAELEQAQQSLLDSELQQGETGTHDAVRTHLRSSLSAAEQVLNGLSASLELPRLLLLGDQEQIRRGAMERVQKVLTQREGIDTRLDQVMEGWRLTRLPRIDRDILRLAVVDLESLRTPAPVAFNEAVELANRYSDEQGRRMINGVLRRFHDAQSKASA